jgi:formylglycine-generating enzyme required for sulfatase activity
LQELADTDPLPPLPGTGWEEIMLLAVAMTAERTEFLTALMAHNLALAGRCAAQPEVDIAETAKDRLRWALVQRTQDPEADLRARIAAGLALGEVGDPRFVRQQGGWGEYLLPPVIDIPGGTYRIGRDEGVYADEGPVHAVKLQPFAIGQFPVTNAEWRLFMQAGGYEEERWWDTEEARAWRRGEDVAAGAKQQWREVWQYYKANFAELRQIYQQGRMTSQQLEDWESRVRMSADEFEALLDRWYPVGRQTQPRFWNDAVYNHPAQPVVGICWYEARAYCAWLSAQTGQTFRLPTEVEWEAAARGRQGRRYAFGNDFDPKYCNTLETHIRRATPIGVFPGGKTPEGVQDMTGNVWEWTSSAYKPYPYNAVDGREEVMIPAARRAVRGGAWYSIHGLVRASYRVVGAPDRRDDSLGVRVARASPNLS